MDITNYEVRYLQMKALYMRLLRHNVPRNSSADHVDSYPFARAFLTNHASLFELREDMYVDGKVVFSAWEDVWHRPLAEEIEGDVECPFDDEEDGCLFDSRSVLKVFTKWVFVYYDPFWVDHPVVILSAGADSYCFNEKSVFRLCEFHNSIHLAINYIADWHRIRGEAKRKNVNFNE